MTAAGIALILGGLAILVCARRILRPTTGPSGRGSRRAPRKARRAGRAALPAAPTRLALTATPTGYGQSAAPFAEGPWLSSLAAEPGTPDEFDGSAADADVPGWPADSWMNGVTPPPAALPSFAPSTPTPLPDAPVSAIPVWAIPVSAIPVSAIPVSAIPVSAIPVSAIPVSTVPVSTVPVSALPVSAAPVSATPTSAMPFIEAVVPAAGRTDRHEGWSGGLNSADTWSDDADAQADRWRRRADLWADRQDSVHGGGAEGTEQDPVRDAVSEQANPDGGARLDTVDGPRRLRAQAVEEDRADPGEAQHGSLPWGAGDDLPARSYRLVPAPISVPVFDPVAPSFFEQPDPVAVPVFDPTSTGAIRIAAEESPARPVVDAWPAAADAWEPASDESFPPDAAAQRDAAGKPESAVGAMPFTERVEPAINGAARDAYDVEVAADPADPRADGDGVARAAVDVRDMTAAGPPPWPAPTQGWPTAGPGPVGDRPAGEPIVAESPSWPDSTGDWDVPDAAGMDGGLPSAPVSPVGPVSPVVEVAPAIRAGTDAGAEQRADEDQDECHVARAEMPEDEGAGKRDETGAGKRVEAGDGKRVEAGDGDGDGDGDDEGERAGQRLAIRRRMVTVRVGQRPGTGPLGEVPGRSRVTHPRAEARRRLTAATEVIPAVSDMTAMLPAVSDARGGPGSGPAGAPAGVAAGRAGAEGVAERSWEPGRPWEGARPRDDGPRPRPRPRPRPSVREERQPPTRSTVYVSRHAAD